MSESSKQPHALAPWIAIAAALGGVIFSRYCGIAIWAPAGFLVLLVVLFTKTTVHPPWFRSGIAVTLAQVIWLMVAAAVSGFSTWAWAPDALVFIGLVFWLWTRPGLSAALTLALFHAALLGFHLHLLKSPTVGDVMHRVNTAASLVHTLAIVCLCLGYSRFRRDRAETCSLPDIDDPNHKS